MKKLIIILSLFISYSSYAQYVPKAGNKLNTKPNGILVPTSTTDDTPIARLELLSTGSSTVKSSALDTVSLLATKANTLTLAQIQTRFGSGQFFPNPTYFSGGGTSTGDYFTLSSSFLASKQDALVSGTNIKTLGGVSLLGSGDYGILSSTYGGTGVNNGGRLLTYAGAVTFAGAFTNTITTTANTTVTFPTTGTLYGTATGSVTSAQLATTVSNETGNTLLVFNTAPTLTQVNLTAGTATVAPLTFNSGALLTTPLAGREEFLTDRRYFTQTTGTTRQTYAWLSDIGRPLVLTGSGTGAATTISIAHGLTGVTSGSYVTAQPRNAASTGISYVTVDATNVNILYTVAPASGTGNLSYSVEIKP